MSDCEEHDDKHVAIQDTECSADSGDAILVSVGGEDIWIPQSQVHADSEVYGRGHSGTLVVTKWIARKKGLWDD